MKIAEDESVRVTGLEEIYERIIGRQITRTRALLGVDFAVGAGEFVSIIGPSGCGKTTVLKILAGLVQPTAGEVRVRGMLSSGPGTDRAIVFQQPALMPWRNVLDNVTLPLEFSRIPKPERHQRAQKYLSLVGLSSFYGHYPGELSGGMQQRVGLARALAVEPEILLMDEPFGALDAITRQQMQRELVAIWESERKAVLFVTHSIEEAQLLSDRILVMKDGRIIECVGVPLERPREQSHVMKSDAAIDIRQRLEELL